MSGSARMQSGSDGHTAVASVQLYREVHKHAYLRHISIHHGKKSGGDQYWVVFCVHCDTVPYLEFYSNQVTSATHQPIWRMCLTGTTSVSGALVPQGKLYRLTLVTRESGIILGAPSWEDMKEWVDTLRSKLREMKILGPAENLYSKPPEQMVRNRAPTRDPTSPLPPPPPGPAAYVPGTELHTRNSLEDTTRTVDYNISQSAASNHRNSNEVVTPVRPSGDNATANISQTDEISVAGSVRQNQGEEAHNNNIQSGGTPALAGDPATSTCHPLDNSREVNRLQVLSQETTAQPSITGVPNSPPLQESGMEERSRAEHPSNCESIESVGRREAPGTDRVSKLKEFSRYKSSKEQEANTKICKDGGLILYNNTSTTNCEQWEDLPAVLRSSLCQSGGSQERCADVSPTGSRVANISGMNVCLVDSVLPPNRSMAGGSSDEDFDMGDEFVPRPTEYKNVVNIKRDSKGYTQVNVNNKNVGLPKNKLLLPLETAATSGDTELVTVTSTAHVDSNEDNVEPVVGNFFGLPRMPTSHKPIPLPRTKLDEMTNSNPSVGSTRQDGGYVVLSECGNTDGIVMRDSRDKKKNILNRTSSVPDSIECEHILDTFYGQMVEAQSPCSSTKDPNVTIIAVPSQSQDTPVTVQDRKYVNVSVTNIDSREPANHVSGSSNPYGHISASTHKEGGADATSSPHELKRTSFEGNETNILKNRENERSSKSNIPIPRALEIPEFQSVKNLGVRAPTTHTKDFYESVFGPFGTKENLTTRNVPVCVVQVPTLVVNIPSTRQIPEKSIETCQNSSWGVSSEAVDNVFVTSIPSGADTDRDTARATTSNHHHPANRESDYEFLSWHSGEATRESGRAAGRSDTNHQAPVTEANGQAKRPGLFTRGLTELNIMSKFRTLSINNRGVGETNAGEQSSGHTDPTASGPNVPQKTGERVALSTKINNIFNKFSDSRLGASGSGNAGLKNPNLLKITKTESSLRRNWSEHNDRTAPLNIARSQNAKPLRPRPPAIMNVVNRRAATNQNADNDNRRRSNSLNSTVSDADEASSNQNRPVVPMLSLREQQVMKLRNEMGHSGGIRLLLSSRDSPEQAVALVDIYSGVWVAGWKQRTHPLLYNALHIGDRLHSVDGCVVSNARQARRAIQNRSGFKVEIIIKRLPHGRVFALKRESDRQDLGLMIDGANITGIAPNSPAQKAGVPTSGTLTEVNGRPLNLLLKKGSSQVRERLSSVGREVSILVQPTEFVSLLRTALKAVRGCKDYIVQ